MTRLKAFLFLFFFTSLASAENFDLLSQEQFHTLTRDQQVQYLVGVQKILVGMSKMSSYLAGHEEKNNSRSPANDPWVTAPKELAVLKDEFKGGRKISPSIAGGVSEPPTAAPVSAPAPAAAPAAASAPAVAHQPAPSAKPVAEKGTDKKPASAAKEQKYYRCMHSGWVVDGEHCVAPTSLPKEWGIDGLNPEKIRCDATQSMCNPIIFGLDLPKGCDSLSKKKECSLGAKPFCATKTLWPTEECYTLANANSNRGTKVAAEIYAEIKPKLLEDYSKKMKNLCKKENIENNPAVSTKNGKPRSDKSKQAVIDDITKTCEWADKQVVALNEIHKSLFTVEKAEKPKDNKPATGAK